MPTFMSLFKLTDQGAKEIKEVPGNIKEAFKGIEALWGKLKDFYVVTGEYDFVGISEFPSDEVYMTNVLSVISRGGVRATTMKAFSLEEFTEIVKKLP
jgi:uncharacterized protein with GYD domain